MQNTQKQKNPKVLKIDLTDNLDYSNWTPHDEVNIFIAPCDNWRKGLAGFTKSRFTAQRKCVRPNIKGRNVVYFHCRSDFFWRHETPGETICFIHHNCHWQLPEGPTDPDGRTLRISLRPKQQQHWKPTGWIRLNQFESWFCVRSSQTFHLLQTLNIKPVMETVSLPVSLSLDNWR